MTLAVAVVLFAASLAVTLYAAATFARRLDGLGARFGFPEVVIGLLTAAAADGPEVSSAVAALAKGEHAASVGVIVGSNAFNLAAMLGVGALLAGRIRVRRQTLALEGVVAVAVTAVAAALLLGWLGAALAALLLGCVLTPYLVVVVAGGRLAGRPRLPAAIDWVVRSAIDQSAGSDGGRAGEHFATRRQLALMGVDVALIVGGSVGMVSAALSLGSRWGVAPALVGALALGPLTSLPNAMTGLRLGLAGRGAALVTEALNSNTINLAAGVVIPALFVSLSAHSVADRVDLGVLVAMTLGSLALLRSSRGLGRRGGVVLVAMYAAFVVVELVAG